MVVRLSWTGSKADFELFMSLISPGHGDRVLDVGAGSGKVARLVMEASGCDLYSVEPEAKRVAASMRASPPVKASRGTAESIPFESSFFDRAYSTMAFHHFADQEAGIAEVARVVKPGGAFVLLDVEPGSRTGRMFRFMENFLMRRGMKFRSMEEAIQMLQGGGFDVVKAVRGKAGYFILSMRKGSISSSGG